MITRKELLESKEFWLVKLQAALYEQVENYLKDNKMTKTEFATKLGVSKGYISQVLNGDFDHKLSKFIELSLAIDKAPMFRFEDLSTCHSFDAIGALDTVERSSFKPSIFMHYSTDITITPAVEYSSDTIKRNITRTIESSPSFFLTAEDLNDSFIKTPAYALA